tara:strand:+ start:2056 stop:2403 length:348 start_codon:yes stop_codon:yes gene_type:complete
MAQTFPSIEASFGVTKKTEPFVTTTRFQDGYEQVIKFGLNINPKEYSLSFNNITEAESDTIENFLNARIEDGDYFNWQAPDEATTSKYRALDRDKEIRFPGRATITVTFREVFEP